VIGSKDPFDGRSPSIFKRGLVFFKMGLADKCPVNSALEGGVKGHPIRGKYLTGKPRRLGRGASLEAKKRGWLVDRIPSMAG